MEILECLVKGQQVDLLVKLSLTLGLYPECSGPTVRVRDFLVVLGLGSKFCSGLVWGAEFHGKNFLKGIMIE